MYSASSLWTSSRISRCDLALSAGNPTEHVVANIVCVLEEEKAEDGYQERISDAAEHSGYTSDGTLQQGAHADCQGRSLLLDDGDQPLFVRLKPAGHRYGLEIRTAFDEFRKLFAEALRLVDHTRSIPEAKYDHDAEQNGVDDGERSYLGDRGGVIRSTRRTSGWSM